MSTDADVQVTKDDLEAIYDSDEWIDVTDRIQCYENGKTFSCDCGQGIGVVHDKRCVSCATCGTMCFDFESDSRGPPERSEGQASLMDF